MIGCGFVTNKMSSPLTKFWVSKYKQTMALSHFRGLLNPCRCTNQVLMHKKALCTVKPLLMNDDFSALHTRQFSMACLNRHSFGDLPKHSDHSFSCHLQRKNFSSCSVKLKNIVSKDYVAEVMENIDIEEIKEQWEKEKTQNLQPVSVSTKVKDILSQKCDEVVANLDPEDKKKLKVIQLEHSFMLSEGYHIPNTEELLSKNWLEALKLPSKSQRLKYYSFLAKSSFIKRSQELKKIAKKENQGQERLKPERYEHGRMFMRIYESTIKRWYHHRLVSSMMYGTPLVIDMDYASYMQPREIKNTASQLNNVYNLNRADHEDMPFHLHFTGCHQEHPVFKFMRIFQQDEPHFLSTVTEKSYLDLFDKKTLVYLSPNGRQVMRQFDPSAVYIIGAYNDKSQALPLSYARAQEQKIRCQRLPLDEYMKWNLGSKALTLDQMVQIMMSLKNKKTWPEAFKVIPKRKLKCENSEE